MKFSATFATTAASTQVVLTEVMTIERSRNRDDYLASLMVYGTFAGSTVTFQLSPGTTATLINAKDVNGTTMAYSANGYGNLQLGGDSNNISTDVLKLYASAGTSTGALSLTFAVYDNR